MYELEFSANFLIKLDNAVAYYKKISDTLSIRFFENLNDDIEKIKRNPFHFGFVIELPSKRLRRCNLKKFPYVILYEIVQNKIYILNLHNTNQHPVKKLLR